MQKNKKSKLFSKSPFPSFLFLPRLKLQDITIFEYLLQRFPQIDAKVWKDRILNGDVFFEHGGRIDLSTPYSSDKKLCYFREVSKEPELPFGESIIFQNQHFLIACKPHFIPVTPSGNYVNSCLLYRLRKSTGLSDLVAVHRLDIETAGLVLFSCSKKSRGLYSELFRTRKVLKTYEAIGYSPFVKNCRYWSIENRISQGDPWFISLIEKGTANAISEISLIEAGSELSYYQLIPHTGKKHQLRIHLGLISKGIVNDSLYPKIEKQKRAQDFSNPLQLLAKKLEFHDPVTGDLMRFRSERKLNWIRSQKAHL
ncbi:MAG: pseudouridine synthase [Proteobacteria bacterium]|nr:pseudouridine synthase [Pseudomonadota bacterium]